MSGDLIGPGEAYLAPSLSLVVWKEDGVNMTTGLEKYPNNRPINQ